MAANLRKLRKFPPKLCILYGEYVFRQEETREEDFRDTMKTAVISHKGHAQAVRACLAEYMDAPVMGEIGFGNGEFLVYLAKVSPHTLFFGLEVSRTCILKCRARAESAGLRNIALLSGDARFLLRECFPDETFDGLYMNFPCPWPKKKHARRRVTAGSFPDVLAAVLKRGGFFEIATDDGDYADEAEKALDGHNGLSCEIHEINPKRPVMTKYERKWTALDKAIHVVRFRKVRPWTIGRISEGGADMHLELEGPAPDMKTLEALHDQQGGTKDERWVFRNCYKGSDGTFLVEALTADEEFQQHFYVRIVPRQRSILIKLDPATKPFVTPAVKKAVQDIHQKLGGGRSK